MKAGLFRARKSRYAFSSLSTLIASTTTPEGAICAANRLRDGVSSTQGGHQVAQKLRTSSLPPNDAAVTVWPLSALIEKSGAESPTVVILSRNVLAMTKTNVTVRTTIARRKRRCDLGLLMNR